MSTSLVVKDADKIERVVLQGDLSKLTPEERISYHKMACDSIGLNPLTKPFEYITLNGKLTLYAKKDATDQLRMIYTVSVLIMAREVLEGIFVVTARATLPNGRTDESIGAVPIDTLKGESRANAMMKAETKAKRRVTLSICGLGMLDETEIESIPSAKPASEAGIKRTTEDIHLDGPAKSAAADRQATKGGAAPELAVRQSSGAEGPQNPSVSADSIPSREPGSDEEPSEFIELGQSVAIHRAFKEAIRNPDAKKASDKFLQSWLEGQGFMKDGNGTTKVIPAARFKEVKEAAVKYAESLPK